MLLLPKASYRFRVISIKIPTLFFTEIENTILIFIWNHRRPQIARTILRKDKAGGITVPDFKLWYKAIRTVQYWHNSRHTEVNPNISGQLIFDREARNAQWGKDSLFKKWLQEIQISICKRMNLGPYLTSPEINSKDQNVGPEAVKFLEENRRKSPFRRIVLLYT